MNAITHFSAATIPRVLAVPVAVLIAGVLLTMTTVASARAGVVITGTRIVYEAKQKEATVRFENKNERPTLVQVWLDDGNEEAAPEKTDVPFILTPPVFRMEPGKQHVARLVYTGERLPTDKESLFWLNMLEVPPKTSDAESNQLQLAFRTRIKVFFRPAGLPYEVSRAPEKLQWMLVATEQGPALEAHNPTPYYVSFDQIELVEAGTRHAKSAGGLAADNMVGPGASNRFFLPTLKLMPGATAEVEFQTLDDYATKKPHKASLTP